MTSADRRGTNELRVLIYCPHLLPLSQPWAYQHATLLPQSEVWLVGRKRSSPSINVSSVRHVSLDELSYGRSEGRLFLSTGHSPRLTQLVASFRPQVIHAHFGPGGTEVARLARAAGIPLVVSYHGWDAWMHPSDSGYARLHLWRRQRMFAQATLVLTSSQWLRQRVVAIGCPTEKTEVHYLGVDREIFDGQRAPDDGPVVAMVGRLVPIKATELALEAFRLLRDRGTSFRAEIIGDGPRRQHLQELIDRNRLPVTLRGAQPQAVTRDLLARARVFCATSTILQGGQAESFGLAAAEAQAMGVPVVATATGGLPEAVANGKTGILVSDGDALGLANALDELLSDRRQHQQMSAAGIEWVAEHFDSRDAGRQLRSRYADIIANPTSSRARQSA
jgi:colanic acid/amylovoran biosynthesis glycosyltransferase